RRAIALKRSSSSCANCFSKPSSRLSNVVVIPPSLLRSLKSRALAVYCRLAYRPQPVKATLGRSFTAKIRSGKRRRCVIVLHLPIGLVSSVHGRWPRQALPVRSRSRGSAKSHNKEPRQSDGLSQTTVHAH